MRFKIMLVVLLLGGTWAGAASESNGFDPDLHIEASELKVGMRGYGMTVFAGTKIEMFDVEVVSVMNNYTPKRNAILIMCDDDRFRIARGVQGVSGSPVFFDGRLAGAMAFGWAFGEEPLYGVTPIREMLDVRSTGEHSKKKSHDETLASHTFGRQVYENMMRPKLLSSQELAAMAQAGGLVRKSGARESVAIAVNGLNATALKTLNGAIENLVFEVGLAGGGAGDWGGGEKPKLERGAAVTVPLMKGDINGAVLGTVTEVIGDHVYAFGHPWNASGSVRWPMATGRVHTFVNRKNISFKLGDAVEVVGTVWADETPAIYGQVGETPAMIPVDVSIRWGDLQQEEAFQVAIADEQNLSPILATVATLNSAAYRGELPPEHTIGYEVKIEFDGAPSLEFSNISSGMGLSDLMYDMLEPIAVVLRNPWEKVRLKKVSVSVSLEEQDRLYQVVSIDLPKRQFAPGEVIRAHAVLEPLREERVSCEIELKIPETVEEGEYEIEIGSFIDYQQALSKATPHLFRPATVKELSRVLQKRLSVARNGVYMSMALPKRGVAIQEQALPTLPGSRAMLLTDKSRQGRLTKFGDLLWSRRETDYVVAGTKMFEIQVQREH